MENKEDFDIQKVMDDAVKLSFEDFAEKLKTDDIFTKALMDYFQNIQGTGMRVIDAWAPQKKADFFTTGCMGHVLSFALQANPKDAVFLIQLMAQHNDLFFTLIASAVSMGVGLAITEELK